MMLFLEKEQVEILADLVLDQLEQGVQREAVKQYAKLYTVLAEKLQEEERREKDSAELKDFLEEVAADEAEEKGEKEQGQMNRCI